MTIRNEPQPCLNCAATIYTFGQWFSETCPHTEQGHEVERDYTLPMEPFVCYQCDGGLTSDTVRSRRIDDAWVRVCVNCADDINAEKAELIVRGAYQ